jgi:hypothetical protein
MYKLAKMTAHRQLACPEKRVPVPSLSPQTLVMRRPRWQDLPKYLLKPDIVNSLTRGTVLIGGRFRGLLCVACISTSLVRRNFAGLPPLMERLTG